MSDTKEAAGTGTGTQALDRSIDLGTYVPRDDDDVLVCRCEEVTRGDVRRAVHDGMFTMTEVRRYLRVGMGLCQGQSCTRLVRRIMAAELHVSPATLEAETSRAPMRPVEMRVLGDERTEGQVEA
jgi:NAD(P)H-nitrite reductase large subunit